MTDADRLARRDDDVHGHPGPPSHRLYLRGCRHPDCREAWRAWSAQRRRLVAYGRIESSRNVDPGPARRRLLELRKDGIGRYAAAKGTGVHVETLRRILDGTNKHIRSTTERKILTWTPDLDQLAPRVHVPGVGTRRRLRALIATGWTIAALAERIGCTPNNIAQVIHHDGRVRVSTARAVRDLYAEAWQGPPVPRNGYQARVQREARARALANGWPPPLAWDDEAIDDPDARPLGTLRATPDDEDTLDDVAIQGALAGHQTRLSTAELDVVTATLTQRGMSAAQIARHLGLTPRTITRSRSRNSTTDTRETA